MFKFAEINLGTIIKPHQSHVGGKVAIIDLSEESPREFSYEQLDRMANGVASEIKKMNLVHGSRIAIIAENSAEYMVSYLGILRAGMVAVLINYKLPAERILKILEHSKTQLIFSDRLRKNLNTKIKNISFKDEFLKLRAEEHFEIVVPQQGEVAFLIYTSGSTSGELKGVMISHEGHLWMLNQRMPKGTKYQKYVETDEFKQVLAAPMYHMNGLTNIESLLLGGGTAVLLPYFDPKLYAKAIEQYRVVSIKAVPPMLAMLFADKDLMEKSNFSCVKSVHLGGAPLSQTLFDKIKKHFFNAVGNIYNSYGLTEGGSGLFQKKHPKNLPLPDLSVGYPRKDVEYRLLDGVLQIKAPSMLKGYLDDHESTKKNFTEDGYLITRDIFRVDENGFYFFEGRADDMFVSGGENIFPNEIEEVIERHPSVENAVVVPLPDEIKGHKPYAFVVVKKGMSFSEEEIKNFTLANAPAYHHPRRVWQVESIPLTGSNKVNRALLMSRAKTLLDESPKTN